MNNIIEKQRAFFQTGVTKPYLFRIENLKKLKQALKLREAEIFEALKLDLNKSTFEAYATELGVLYVEINHALKHLKQWMKPKRVKTPRTLFGSKSEVRQEPYGVSLIIAPSNYPFQLQIAPLIGAIAAGNCAVLKPSELTPHVSAFLYRLIGDIFPEDYIAVIEGGEKETTKLLAQPFDHIFFTGSVAIGKIIMKAAAEQLIPVTLELGGKSPAIVDKDADLDLAAKRIVWGKFINAGQTCVAPDYLLIHADIKPLFLKKLQTVIMDFYGTEPLKNDTFGKIVNEQHFNRLTTYLTNGELVIGGDLDDELLKIEPTILDEITWDDPIMHAEIFGPILPVLTFHHLNEVVKMVTSRPKPLALYYFSQSKDRQNQVIEQIPFGGGCINDTIIHLLSPYLPFGGVGSSGIGSYHGEYSFRAFSHEKSILRQTTRFDFAGRYPNHKYGLRLIKRLLK